MKNKKLFGATFLFVAALILSACHVGKSTQQSTTDTSNQQEVNQQIYNIYELYRGQGGTLTYEQWLESIRGPQGVPGPEGPQGPKGNDGHTPDIYIEGGYWYIDGNNTTVRAQGEQGAPGADGTDGEDGLSAYEIYKKNHPDYNKSESQWLNDLVNGRLGTKTLHTVSFDTQGAIDDIASQSVLHGEKAVKPEDPSKDGYIFDGWYYQGEPWAFQGYVVTNDMTLTAKWSEAYEAYFYDHDDTILYHGWYKIGEEPVYPYVTPTRADEGDIKYQFSGWKKFERGPRKILLDAQYEACSKSLVTSGNTVYLANDSTATTVVIPSTWDGTTITEIGSFKNSSYLVSVIIPNTVERIGNNAFSGCTSLESVVIPDSVISIGQSAFSNCTSLKTVHMGDNVKTIEAGAFGFCSALEEINISANVETVGAGAFAYCSSLKSIFIGDKCTSLGKKAFDSCASLETAVFGKNIHAIEDSTFYGCSSMKSMTFKGMITHMEFMSFWCCGYEPNTSDAELNMDVYFYMQHIDQWFDYSITTTCLGNFHLFVEGNSEEVTELNVPLSITQIGTVHGIFSSLTSIKKIYLPATLETIASGAFNRFYSLEKIYVDQNNENYCSEKGILYDKAKKQLIKVPMMYSGDVTIPSTVMTGVSYDTFALCENIENIYVESGGYWFSSYEGCLYDYNKTRLISVPRAKTGSISFPESCLRIGEWSFYKCLFSEITIPESVKYIENNVFVQNNSLKTLTIQGDGVSVGINLCNGCEVLENIIFEGENVGIAEQTFSGLPECFNYNIYGNGRYIEVNHNPYYVLVKGVNKDIQNIEVHSSCEMINSYAFSGYANLETLDLSKTTLTSLPTYICYNCTSLKSVMFSSSLEKINACAFYGCESLTTLTLPTSLKILELQCFRNCTGLVSMRFNDGLTEIGDNSFEGCSSLKNVYIPYSVKNICIATFKNCSSLSYFVVDTNPELYVKQNAFAGCDSLSAIYRLNTNTFVVHNTGNDIIFATTSYFYSEEAPTEQGNYWRYVDGVPTPWN